MIKTGQQRRQLTFALAAGLLSPWTVGAAAAAAAAPDWADQLRRDLDKMAAHLTQTLKPWKVPNRVFLPEDHGLASGAAPAATTTSIQRAIEACATAGGGTVRLAKGDYVSGTLVLRSGVMLEVAEGARLLASTDLHDFPEHVAKRPTVMDSNMGMNQSLIFAEGCERIGICGKGMIDGRGTKDNFPGEETAGSTPGRPFLIRVIDCRQVVVRGIHLKDSPCWMQNYLNCEDLIVDGIRVDNQANHNNDGLDIDSCRRVIVRNSFINAEDDAMCFKGAGQRLAEDILVENCEFYSTCNALKFGTDSQGDFRNVLVRNVTVGGPSDAMRAMNRRKADGGISWEIVDGGTLERVLVHDAHIVRAESPLFLRLGDRGRVRPEQQRPGPGVLRYIVYDRITGDNNGMRGSFFSGIPERAIEHVLLRDVSLGMAAANAPAVDQAAVPEAHAEYPDPHMFSKVMPAYGLWARHIRQLRLQRVRFSVSGADARPEVLAGVDAEVLRQ
ncbi:glycoside hydrolase family 28 protein [Pseudoduganella sp. RAF53_2]|uniref:glycoside hydrolase family 28 protein n=1 Tax=unclassified Pseudoduganella TaxID=2637179 RepID=UPI003F9E0339